MNADTKYLQSLRNALWNVAADIRDHRGKSHEALAGILVELGYEVERFRASDGPFNLGSIEPQLRDIVTRNWLQPIPAECNRSTWPDDVYVERS